MRKPTPPSLFGAGLKAFADLFKPNGGSVTTRVASAVKDVNKAAEEAAKAKGK